MATTVTINSGNNEWYTPAYVLDIVRAWFVDADNTIGLDPASSAAANANVKALKYYTQADDGLAQDWSCDSLFLNPPYSRDLFPKFIDKFISTWTSAKGPSAAAVLCNNNTETGSGQKLLKHCSFALFFDHRIKFLDSDNKQRNTPTQGQVLYLFGRSYSTFVRTLRRYSDFFSLAEAHGTLLYRL